MPVLVPDDARALWPRRRIESDWGGTPVQAWTQPKGLAACGLPTTNCTTEKGGDCVHYPSSRSWAASAHSGSGSTKWEQTDFLFLVHLSVAKAFVFVCPACLVTAVLDPEFFLGRSDPLLLLTIYKLRIRVP